MGWYEQAQFERYMVEKYGGFATIEDYAREREKMRQDALDRYAAAQERDRPFGGPRPAPEKR